MSASGVTLRQYIDDTAIEPLYKFCLLGFALRKYILSHKFG